LANEDTDEYLWTIRHPSTCATYHLTKLQEHYPLQLHTSPYIWEKLLCFIWYSNGIQLEQFRPWRSRAKATQELCKTPNVIRGEMSVGAGAVLTKMSFDFLITYYS